MEVGVWDMYVRVCVWLSVWCVRSISRRLVVAWHSRGWGRAFDIMLKVTTRRFYRLLLLG